MGNNQSNVVESNVDESHRGVKRSNEKNRYGKYSYSVYVKERNQRYELVNRFSGSYSTFDEAVEQYDKRLFEKNMVTYIKGQGKFDFKRQAEAYEEQKSTELIKE